jgi:hypothetical protein
MDQFIKDHCARDGSTRLSEFIRALKAAGINMPRTEIIAALSREFRMTNVSGQQWIVGLSLRSTRTKRFRILLHDTCFFADGLSCPLSALVRAASSLGLTRTEVIAEIEQSGFTIEKASGVYVVRGLAPKEPEYA